jgi:hypothetical protein
VLSRSYPWTGWNTVAVADVVNQAAEELYGLPPGEFTRARDTRAKEVRKDGDREAADAIKGLRKPTVAAWALNQLARRRAKDVKRLVKAGEDLRAAQQELLAGGDRGAFQAVAAKERELVADLSSDATAMASEAGERGSGLQEKIAETLHAAALDEEAAEELSAGRLVREREAIGGFGGAGNGPAPSPRKAKAKPKGKSAEKSPSKAARGKASAEQRQRLSAARTDERHARRELDAAARALEHAQERADAAEAAAAEAAKRARTTKERLQEAKRAAATAKKAHGRAERALETAEKG